MTDSPATATHRTDVAVIGGGPVGLFCVFEGIEHMAFHVQHSALEHAKQADRAGADDGDIGPVGGGRGRIGHGSAGRSAVGKGC